MRFSPNVRPDILISTERMHEIVTEWREWVRAARHRSPPREFDGTVMSDAVPKAGHLPGAQSLYWKTLLESGSFPSLRDAINLQELFQHAGVDANRQIVTYCRTGMQSSFTYFVAKYLGYNASMYDGSVYEWVNGAGYELSRSAPQPDRGSNR